MKRYLLIFLFIASFAYAEEPCWECNETLAWGLINQMGQSVAAASCTTANDSVIFNYLDTTVGEDLDMVRYSTGAALYAQMELGSTSYTITRYVFSTYDSDGAGSLQGALYLDSSDSVSTIIADTDVQISHTEIGGSPLADVTFTLGTPKTGVTGTKWVGFTCITSGRFYANTIYVAGERVRTGTSTYTDNRTLQVDVYG